MRTLLIYSLFLTLIFISCKNPEKNLAYNDRPNVIPAIQKWEPAKGFFTLTSTSQIKVDKNHKDLAKTFADDLNLLTGINVPVENNNILKAAINIIIDSTDISLSKEAYSISIDDNIHIKASNKSGAFYATQTLLQILKQDSLHVTIPKGKITDFPMIKERAFMLDIGRKYFSMDYIKKTIRNMAWYKQNVFHIHFSDWCGFRLKSDKFRGLASDKAYSKAEIREIQDYAKKYNIMVVPEIDLPAHATEILKYNPNFGFKCESMQTSGWLPDSVNVAKKGWILNITKPEVRTFVAELLDEFIPLFDAPYFHVGGDEWQYDEQKHACDELMQYTKKRGFEHPGDVYVEWINEINKQVKSYGKTTQIWNWWRFSPNAEKQNKTSIQPDLDIVINVWNRSRQKEILKDGYNVILTPETGLGSLYITPGSNGKKAGDYGYFDSKYNYETWEPITHEQIRGYKICMWADNVENREDTWFDKFADLPKAVFSEKVWGKKTSKKIEDFYKRVELIGLAPSE
ncbi:beta-N-acetylhexosaminidase [Abyssalbus ytuae]|uniref:beta-N-acetylhexosaminidase n=1 Tax=Abyssalbus ytuae TaxID=2926907 RepID=A0A9E6ZY57_9FLAO|nr:beta-N-acetylhexosaminidase [Abyssalbus ytuae]UOB16041.1 beta-N-acetylhexosaminidase [Abyssalbus ytuae]